MTPQPSEGWEKDFDLFRRSKWCYVEDYQQAWDVLTYKADALYWGDD